MDAFKSVEMANGKGISAGLEDNERGKYERRSGNPDEGE